MGMTITKGRELSMWETIAIGYATSKKPNPRTGKTVNFAVLTLRNAKYPATPVHREIIFEDDDPELLMRLADLKVQDPKDATRFIVPMSSLGCHMEAVEDEWGDPTIFRVKVDNPDTGEFFKKYVRWPGARLEPMRLRKGMCYGNDVDGKRNTVTRNGVTKPVTTDTVRVFTQVDYIMQGEDGNMKTIYVDGRDPQTQLNRIESRFFIEAVSNESASEVVITAAPKQNTAPNPDDATVPPADQLDF